MEMACKEGGKVHGLRENKKLTKAKSFISVSIPENPFWNALNILK